MTEKIRMTLFTKAASIGETIIIGRKLYRFLEEPRLTYDLERVAQDYYEAHAVDGDYNIYLVRWDVTDCEIEDEGTSAGMRVLPPTCKLWKSAEEIEESDIEEMGHV